MGMNNSRVDSNFHSDWFETIQDLVAEFSKFNPDLINEVEDAGQELALWVYKNPQRLKLIKRPRAFFSKTLRRTIFRLKKKTDRCFAQMDDHIILGMTARSVKDDGHACVQQALLNLEQMNPLGYKVIQQRFNEGCSYKQIARLLGKSRQTVSTICKKALGQISDLIKNTCH